ncbi:unnamed protein product [Caenorhabditis bovis]|uniref:Potassium channel domain-containing protein n=1 Tax=Caenorhabditis bovis TaxID=2654633 RepID=A0A8S1FCH4_9PELO|nr:unnamed protein product [Caenorhabditis bovis]
MYYPTVHRKTGTTPGKKQVSFSLDNANDIANEPAVDDVELSESGDDHNENMNAGHGYNFVRRRDTIVDENAMQHLLLHESIWSNAFRKRRRFDNDNASTVSKFQRFAAIIQIIYDKSRVHNLIPIILLIAYSVIGGLIFWSIEKPHEEVILAEKRNFIGSLTNDLLEDILYIHTRLVDFNRAYRNDTDRLNLHYRDYRKYALNKLHKSVYWYTLSTFYLTEHEMHKVVALRPREPEPIWKRHFESNLGRIRALKNYTDQLCLRCWELGVEGAANGWTMVDYSLKVNASVEEYNMSVGLGHVLTPVWTFWNAMFLAVTTYTTIGYGNITAKTDLGKLAAMVYAVIGIPLVLMILHKSGRLFLMGLERMWDFMIRVAEHFCVGSGKQRVKVSEEDRISEMPLTLAIGVAFSWMFLCAAIFLRFEKDWDYFKSFYFFFCSLTTIGYGDVTPTNSEDMFIIFGLIIIGLSLVSMCINVIQLKLEKFFEELLLTLMEEYNADPDGTRLKAGTIGMMEMWRAWKKRKGRIGNGLEKAKSARIAANKASENFVKMLPFSRRRERQHLIAELQRKLQRKDKSTQTDFYSEEVFNEPSDVDSCVTDFRNSVTSEKSHAHLLLIPDGPICGPSRCESRPVVAMAEPSFCSSSSLVPPSLPSLTNRASSPFPTSSSSSRMSGSAKSAPAASPNRQPIDFDPTRRWTFVATNRNQRGQPRGLVVPYMYTRNLNSVVHKTEVRRLIAEIDVRLQDCRSLNTPNNSVRGTVTGSSMTRSLRSESSIPEEL